MIQTEVGFALLLDLNTTLVKQRHGFLGGYDDLTIDGILLGVDVHAAHGAHVPSSDEALHVFQIVLEGLSQLRHLLGTDEGKDLDVFDIFKVQQGYRIDEGTEVKLVVGASGVDLQLSLIELVEYIGIYGVEHVGSHVSDTCGENQGVSHDFLIVIRETVLRQLNDVVFVCVADFDTRGVPFTHCQFLCTVGSAIDVNLLRHTRRTNQIIVNGTETKQVQVRVILILDLIGENEIIV